MVARATNANAAQRASLLFGIGMATTERDCRWEVVLAGYPMALLPVITLNLVQHIIAGMAVRRLSGLAQQEGWDPLESVANMGKLCPG